MYEYSCTIDRVVDGDTVDVTIDLGFKIFHKARVRMYGIDTPESRTRDLDEKARGLLSKSFLQDALTKANKIIIKTQKDAKGKFGRILGELYADEININQSMINKYLAVAYTGQSKQDIETEHLKNKQKLLELGVYTEI
jgi:micrococcal nuclease|tara:strand:- start:197 stop:613 length:417 start_codon:yes stop_codon:yes gene_type:complete